MDIKIKNRNSELYAYPKFKGFDLCLFRLGGTGLGNLLFPWARFIIKSKEYNLIPICPTWVQVKIGPVIRGEEDKRFYFGLFHSKNDHVTGINKAILLVNSDFYSENDLYDNSVLIDSKSKKIIYFEGMEDLFAPFLKYHKLLLSELLTITREKEKAGLLFNFDNSISIHIRLGDFKRNQPEKKIEEGSENCSIPVSWHCNILVKIRKALGKELPAYIFSDGTDNELSEILKLPNCRRISFGSSVADIIALSQSNLLIASGSTFSMWASFLGRMPIIWRKGQLKQRLYYENENYEIECNHIDEIPLSFIETIKSRVRY